MATLLGQKIKDSYKDLLQVSNTNTGVDGTLRNVSDGEGTDSALQISSTAVKSTGTLDVTGALTADTLTSAGALTLENINIDGNNITSTNTNGNINITPHGTGRVDISKIDIESGTIDDVAITGSSLDSVTIGTTSACTDLRVDNLKLDGNSITATDTNGNIEIEPNGTGTVLIGDVTAINTNSVLALKGDVEISGSGTAGSDLYIYDQDQATYPGQYVDFFAQNGKAYIKTNTAGSDVVIGSGAWGNNIIIEGSTNGNIGLAPHGTGEVDITKVDIASGEIDGVTIGTNSACTDLRVDNIKIDSSTISSTDSNGHIYINPDGTGEIKTAKNITSDSSISAGNLKLDGNTISSLDLNGDINITPGGTGTVNFDNIGINGSIISSTNTDGHIYLTPNGSGMIYGGNVYIGDILATNGTISTADINGGAIDAVTIGTNSAVTDLRVDNLKLDGNEIRSTDTDGNIHIIPDGDGTARITNLVATTDILPAGDSASIDLGSESLRFNKGHFKTELNIDGFLYTDEIREKTSANGVIIDGMTIKDGGFGDLTSLGVDNITIDGNAITSTDTDGDIELTPDGDGEVDITNVDLIGGTVGNVTPVTILKCDNIKLDDSTVSTISSNSDLNLSPQGTGTVVINTDLDVDNININGNTISSTDTDGNIEITPDGDGNIDLSTLPGSHVRIFGDLYLSPDTAVITGAPSGNAFTMTISHGGSTKYIKLYDAPPGGG